MRVREGECLYAADAARRRRAAELAAAQGGSPGSAAPAPGRAASASAPAPERSASAAPPHPGHYDRVLGRGGPAPAAPSPEAARAARLQADIARSPNRDRALATDGDLKKLKAGEPGAADRITPEIRETLLRGVAEPRTDHDRGREGVLGRRQAREAAETLTRMPGADYDAVKQKLDGAKSDTERALILKAVAARKGELTAGTDVERRAALDEVSHFADDIRGMEREKLVRTTSPLDLDGKNTSAVDPEDPHGRAGPDARADNDGLTQRYANSCAPATAQLARGEADPIYAKKLHDEGLERLDDTSTSAREQQGALAGAGSKTQANRKVSDAALTRVAEINGQADEKLKGADRQRVDDFLSGKPVADTAALDAALSRCGTDRDEVERLRRDATGGDGMSMKTAADGLARARTHVDYQEHAVGKDGLTPHLRDIDKKLQDGQDVPISVDYGKSGHALLLTDVRDGKYLVADPYTGRSAWVPKKDLLDGSFTDKHFGMQAGRVDAYFG